MSTFAWIVSGLWTGCFVAEACDDFRTTRGLLRVMARQQRWFWSQVTRPSRVPVRAR